MLLKTNIFSQSYCDNVITVLERASAFFAVLFSRERGDFQNDVIY